MGGSCDPGTAQTKPWEGWAPGFSEESGARGQGLGMGGNEQIQILETSAQVTLGSSPNVRGRDPF